MHAPVIEKDRHDPNPIAKLNRQKLTEAGVFAISVIGGPGCGKTLLVEATIKRLVPDVNVGVIACDLTSHLDADRINQCSDQVVQVNTGQQGVPDATHIHDALQWLDLAKIDVLIIENVGTLVCETPVDLGQEVTVAMFSVAGGHDKADKHPGLVRSAGVVLLNKTDLLSAVPFNIEIFRRDVRRLNGNAELFEISSLTGHGIDQWVDWLRARIRKRQSKTSQWFG